MRLMHKVLVPLAPLALLLGSVLWSGPGQTATAAPAGGQIGPSAAKCPTCPSQLVRFIGSDSGGDYQTALDNALTQADIHFGQFGADLLYTYRVLGTSGRRGGFAGFNDICVEIEAVIPAF